MARNFLPIPFAAYRGTLSGKAFAYRGRTGTMVTAAVNWVNYNVGLEPLGTANPDFNVRVSLMAASAQIVNQNWVVTSVYIDNENVNFPVYVYFPDTQFAVSCPANSSGWYAVYSNARNAFIVALGISDLDIINGAQTNVFFTDVEMTPYLDQEAPTAVQQGISSPVVQLGGTGGAITSINLVQNGLWLVNGAMSITGGGGSGAVANLTSLDRFGRIDGTIVIDNPGANYTVNPLIQASGGFAPPAAYDPATFYGNGAIVSFSGIAWLCITPSGFANGITPGSNPSFWQNTGLSPNAQAPIFSSTISPVVGGVSLSNESNFGDRALGDQPLIFFSPITGIGVFKDNLFDSPYSTGFIYITNAHIACINGTAANDQFVLEADSGGTIFSIAGGAAFMTLLDLQGMNLKLPANQAYRLRCGFHSGGSAGYQFNFAWTYSQTNR